MRLRDNDLGLLWDRTTGFGLDRKTSSRTPRPSIEIQPTRRGPEIPYTDPFLSLHAATLDAAGDARLTFDEPTWAPAPGDVVGVDVESFPNVFIVCAQRFADGKRAAFEVGARNTPGSGKLLRAILDHSTIVTFNGATYDLPMIAAALRGAAPAQLKAMSDRVIKTGMRRWDVEREYGTIRIIDHVDLLEPNPSVRQGLKTLHGRLHGRMLVDLPFDPDRVLTAREANLLTLYCFNDLEATKGLWDAMREPMELRVALGKEYKMDLRSKSDAQIGEAIVKHLVEKKAGTRVGKHGPNMNETLRYEVPSFIDFKSPELRELAEYLASINFYHDGNRFFGFDGRDVKIGAMTYRVGIGGLHSTEERREVISDEEHAIEDADVASQYPQIISKLGMYPPAYGPVFLHVYRDMIRERLEAKAAKQKIKADGFKISLNGVGGRLASAYSGFYAPNIFLAMTLTGQLSVLMIIERCEAAGMRVMSANTDGALIYYKRNEKSTLDTIIAEWEQASGFTAERTPYLKVFSRDVNTYIGITVDGKVKRKGPVADPWEDNDLRAQLMKNPQMTVLSRACVALARDGVSLEETVRACRDMRAMITIQKVTGGAKWLEHELGRVVRYYWSTSGHSITYISNGNRVPRTEGSRPMVELLPEPPEDVDWDRYVAEARKLAIELAIISEST